MTLIPELMYIRKGQNISYILFDGKHIQSFVLSAIARCVHMNKKFSKSFSTTHIISGDNTGIASEKIAKYERELVENLH